MKKTQPAPLLTLSLLIAVFLILPSARAAVTTWNNAAGGNWSVGGNWNTASAPTQADDALFVNTGAGSLTTNNTVRTINSLAFSQTLNGTHNVTLSASLSVNRTNAANGNVLLVGGANLTTALVPVTVVGAPGSALTLSNGDLVVRQGGTGNGSQMATLDLSAVDTFNATIGRLLVGRSDGTTANRVSGTLILARTNIITCNSATIPQVMVQDANVNAN